MSGIILRRLGAAVLSIVLLVTLVFFMAHLTPGGPAYSILGQKATAGSIARLNARLGLDQPLWRQYLLWWAHLAQGRLGYSYLLNRPVGVLLYGHALNSLLLYGTALTLATLLALPLGLLQGLRAEGWPGRIIGGFQLGFYALPPFFTGALLVLWVAADWRWLPAGGLRDLRLAHPGPGDFAAHLVLPVITIALTALAAFSRYFGAAVHEELSQDYVRTARAKGLGVAAILTRHVLRNALRPLVTLLGLYFPVLFTGGVIVESVFDYPGLGWLMWRAALAQDYPVLIAIVLVVGVLTVLGNLLADLVNGWLDPRTRYA